MAPTVKHFRSKLLLSEQDAADVLNITLEDFILKESGSSSFSLNELKTLWNWLIPKMENAGIPPSDYVQFLDSLPN